MKLVTVGKDRGSAMEGVALEYVRKIQRYCTFEEVQLRPNPKNSRYACKSIITLSKLLCCENSQDSYAQKIASQCSQGLCHAEGERGRMAAMSVHRCLVRGSASCAPYLPKTG